MPLDPAQFVAFFESSGCTNTANSRSSASGCFQMIDSTWKTYATQAGIDTTQYPTAGSAPVSDQFAAFGAMYGARGFADYTCSGCDAKLTAALANIGGPSAFAAPGTLSTSPGSYTALDASGAVQTYFANQVADPLGARLRFMEPAPLPRTPATRPALALSLPRLVAWATRRRRLPLRPSITSRSRRHTTVIRRESCNRSMQWWARLRRWRKVH